MTDFLEHDTFSAWVTVDGGARLEVYEAYKERDPTNGKWTISGWIPSKSNQVCLLVYTSHDYKSPLIVFLQEFSIYTRETRYGSRPSHRAAYTFDGVEVVHHIWEKYNDTTDILSCIDTGNGIYHMCFKAIETTGWLCSSVLAPSI
jgi:hypothetical protein